MSNSTHHLIPYFRLFFISSYTIICLGCVVYAKVLGIFYRYRKTHFQNTFYTYIISMGIADLGYGLLREAGIILLSLKNLPYWLGYGTLLCGAACFAVTLNLQYSWGKKYFIMAIQATSFFQVWAVWWQQKLQLINLAFCSPRQWPNTLVFFHGFLGFAIYFPHVFLGCMIDADPKFLAYPRYMNT